MAGRRRNRIDRRVRIGLSACRGSTRVTVVRVQQLTSPSVYRGILSWLRQTVKKTKPARSEKRKPANGGRSFERVFEKIYRLVLRIPRGRVMTYGQIARLLDDRFSPRLVGWAMHATPKDGRDIPWHRVINSRGSISTGRIILEQPDLQQLLLQAEGVVFNERGQCDLRVFQWSPDHKRGGSSSAGALAAASRLRSKSNAGRKAPTTPARTKIKSKNLRNN